MAIEASKWRSKGGQHHIKQDRKIQFLGEKIASNNSQVSNVTSGLKATQDELANRNKQIKRLKYICGNQN